jgi:dipicolinate synthase subunit A
MTGPVRVAVLGGDEREHHIANGLSEIGSQVTTFGGSVLDPHAGYRRARTAREAVAEAEWILCPYPGLTVSDELYSPASETPIRLDRTLLGSSRAHQGGLVLGRASEGVRALCGDLGIAIHETKADSGLVVKTATAVAEALVAILIESTHRLLREHLYVVVGFGSTGLAITQLLLAMRCEVVVAARSRRDRERARQLGARPVAYPDRTAVMETADVVINTVPAHDAVPPAAAVSRITARIFDIASPPGGMDHQALIGAGLDVSWVRGLGGLRAPVSMAEAQLEFVQELLAGSADADNSGVSLINHNGIVTASAVTERSI